MAQLTTSSERNKSQTLSLSRLSACRMRVGKYMYKYTQTVRPWKPAKALDLQKKISVEGAIAAIFASKSTGGQRSCPLQKKL